jgi:hypothetical protein
MIEEEPFRIYLDPQGSIERIRDELRSKLESLNLPTDRSCTEPTDQEIAFSKIYPDAQPWLRRVRHLTEILSEGELAGSLLFYLNKVVKEDALSEQMLTIWMIMDLYANYRVNEINSLARAGAAAKVARTAGPKARSTKLWRVRKIVWQHARQYWQDHPRYQHDASNTAKWIAARVCEDLEANGILPKRGRTEKTIADDIRAGIHNGVFQTGHSGAANGHSGI